MTEKDYGMIEKEKKKMQDDFQDRLFDLVNDKKKSDNCSQENVAKRIGIKPQALSEYLNGTGAEKKFREPGAVALYKIAKYFGVTVDYLLGLSNMPTIKRNIQTACATTGLTQASIMALDRYARTGYNFKQEEAALNYCIEEDLFFSFVDLIVECIIIRTAGDSGYDLLEWEHLNNTTLKDFGSRIDDIRDSFYNAGKEMLVMKTLNRLINKAVNDMYYDHNTGYIRVKKAGDK
jgi:transcriptional regulator with XRE-family HTH domain